MPTRLLIVALDSAEPLLVKKWASAGELPALARMQQDNHEAAVENFPGFGNGVFWPSLNTGTDPSHHGRYFRSQVTAPDYTVEPFHEDQDMKVPPFWAALEADDYQVAIIDPVETGMAFLSRGIEVVRWMAHGRTGSADSSPASIASELINRYGDDPFDGNADAARKAGLPLDELTETLLQRIETKTRAMQELLDEREWDVFYVTYGDPHDIGHLAWHLHEELEQNGNPDNAIQDPVKLCYQALDRSITRLMDCVDDDGQTIVLMGPGMESNVTGNPLLPDILRGLQGRQRHGATSLLARLARFLTQSRLVPKSLREKAKTAKTQASAKMRAASGRPYYTVPHNENAGAIRLSVAGREPNGVVPAGQPYDETCAYIAEKLLEIMDASGKRPIATKVIKVHEQFSGPEKNSLPDLMVVWNRDADLSSVSSARIGTISNPTRRPRSGDHSIRGLVMSDKPLSAEVGATLAPSDVTPILVDALTRPNALHGAKGTRECESIPAQQT